MKIKEKQKTTKVTIAISQILILVIATIAFAWMIGGEVKEVSASLNADCGGTGKCVGQNLCTGEGTVDYTASCEPYTSGIEVCCKTPILKPCQAQGGICTEQNSCLSGSGTVIYPSNSECTDVCCVEATNNDNEKSAGGIPPIVKDLGKTALEAAAAAEGAKLASKGTSTKTGGWLSRLFGKKSGTNVGKVWSDELGWIDSVSPTTPGTPVDEVEKHLLKNLFTKGTLFKTVLQNAAWAAATATIITTIVKLAGASDRNMNALNAYTWGGALVGTIVGTLLAESVGGPPGWLAGVITAAFAAVYMVFGYQVYSREIFTFRVSIWQPPTGGSECNKCNALTIGRGENKVNGCSEYICHSYGAACDWINTDTKYETCTEVDRGDTRPPAITPVKSIYGEDVFPEEGDKYKYLIYAAGAKINYSGQGASGRGCVPTNTPITLAVQTNEVAQCKILYNDPAEGTTPKEKFDKMQQMNEGGAYTLNHTMNIESKELADQSSLNNAGYELTNGGNYKFYIRCMDRQGNVNTADYELQFCTQSGPDTRPPKIIDTNPINNSYLNSTITRINGFTVFTNKPAECKWDTRRVSYSDMTNRFSECSRTINQPIEPSLSLDVGCKVDLNQLRTGVLNRIYVICRDHPEWIGTPDEVKRNTGYIEEINLRGTIRLMINGITINGKSNNSVVRAAEQAVPVTLAVNTAGGAEQGNARCSYSEDGKSYTPFSNDGNPDYTSTNTETLYMPSANYKLYIQCEDISIPTPNKNTTMINFTVQADTTSPMVVRVYKDENSEILRVITDEVAECVYSTISPCTYAFEEGTSMETTDGLQHSVEWDSNSDFYIKCIDEFNHAPNDGACSITVRPFEVIQQEY